MLLVPLESYGAGEHTGTVRVEIRVGAAGEGTWTLRGKVSVKSTKVETWQRAQRLAVWLG